MGLREALESAMDQVENNDLEPINEPATLDVAPQDDIALEASHNRDEHGRFAPKSQKEEIGDALDEIQAKVEETPEETPEISTPIETPPTLVRPSTWKKEYMPIWDKLSTGQQLTPEEAIKLAEYSNQRESEYKKGVSTYRAEAERAKQLEEAINPFVPELQAQGISPAAWINNLGRAHMVLTKANYNDRLAMFQRLAQDYGIQLNTSGNGELVHQAQPQMDPYAQQLMQQLQMVNQEVNTIKSRFQQEEEARLQGEIQSFSSDVEHYPHFEVLREPMAQLLELGKAQDLKTAYEMAKWQVPEVREMEIKQMITAQTTQAQKQSQLQKAKAASVSVKSVTPSGLSSNGVDTKDRRSVLASQLDAIAGGRV